MRQTVVSSWKKLWPSSVVPRDFEPFEQDPTPSDGPAIVQEIVSLGTAMGLEMDDLDIEDFVEEHSVKLTTEELLQFHREQEHEVAEELSEEEEEAGERKGYILNADIRPCWVTGPKPKSL